MTYPNIFVEHKLDIDSVQVSMLECSLCVFHLKLDVFLQTNKYVCLVYSGALWESFLLYQVYVKRFW